jgi:hypothetical protein
LQQHLLLIMLLLLLLLLLYDWWRQLEIALLPDLHHLLFLLLPGCHYQGPQHLLLLLLREGLDGRYLNTHVAGRSRASFN